MNWWQAIILGLVQGLTEFLPVSSSGHLVIFSKLLGVDGEGFLDFTVTVHLATVIATIVVFWKVIWDLLKGLLKFKYNDETDYILKILVSLIPVMLVGFLLKDWVEGLFSGGLHQIGFALCATAALLILSDYLGKSSSCHCDQAKRVEKSPNPAPCHFDQGSESAPCHFDQAERAEKSPNPDPCHFDQAERAEKSPSPRRNGISWWQAFVVGIAQAIAVIPGVSRSGSTIATGLLCGVERKGMAQFSFLMVLIPILGEQFLDLLKVATGSGSFGAGVGPLALVLGFVAAFASGLFACKVMIAIVKKAKLTWFAAYCVVVAALIFFLS